MAPALESGQIDLYPGYAATDLEYYNNKAGEASGDVTATVAKLKPYVANMKMNYLVLQGLDRDDIQDAYGPLFGIPVTVLISRDGKVCAKHVGLSSKDGFEREITSLLGPL